MKYLTYYLLLWTNPTATQGAPMKSNRIKSDVMEKKETITLKSVHLKKE